MHFFKAKDIRTFAIEKLSKTNIPCDYLPLLIANYKKGDEKLLANIASRFNDEHIIHCLAWSYIDIFKANETTDCKKTLEIIYEKLTCSMHRYDIVHILYENQVLSDQILQEMEFDVCDLTRALYQKIMGSSSTERANV